MLTTTFRLAKEAKACQARYKRFARHVGGVRKYGRDIPIPLTEVADVLGLDDALWCLRITQQTEEAERLSRLLAADYAEHVLPAFESQFPDDSRPRSTIVLIKHWLDTGEECDLGAAADAAWSAAYAARSAAYAARSAAYAARAAAYAAWAAAYAAWAAADAARAAADAARSAEREWQLKRFKEVIGV
ncbi:MAG: hypothetical protein KKB38_20365 [Gammaproteobacteria bacterium]|nr:hypothetical protein [Gammaproteobacteria bacterium]